MTGYGTVPAAPPDARIGLVAMVRSHCSRPQCRRARRVAATTRAIDRAQRQAAARSLDSAAGATDARRRDSGRAAGVPRTGTRARRLARSLGTLGSIQSDPATGTLRFVGRLDGFLTRRERALGRLGRAPLRAREPHRVRASRRRPAVVPAATRLRRHRRHPPPLVGPARGRPHPVRPGPARRRDARTAGWSTSPAAPCADFAHRATPARLSAGAAIARGPGRPGRRRPARDAARHRRAGAVPDRTGRPARVEDDHLREPQRDRPVVGRRHHRRRCCTATT